MSPIGVIVGILVATVVILVIHDIEVNRKLDKITELLRRREG